VAKYHTVPAENVSTLCVTIAMFKTHRSKAVKNTCLMTLVIHYSQRQWWKSHSISDWTLRSSLIFY